MFNNSNMINIKKTLQILTNPFFYLIAYIFVVLVKDYFLMFVSNMIFSFNELVYDCVELIIIFITHGDLRSAYTYLQINRLFANAINIVLPLFPMIFIIKALKMVGGYLSDMTSEIIEDDHCDCYECAGQIECQPEQQNNEYYIQNDQNDENNQNVQQYNQQFVQDDDEHDPGMQVFTPENN